MSAPEPMIILSRYVAAANPTLRINTGSLQTVALTLSVGFHYPTEDDEIDALLDALNTNSNGVTWTHTLSDDGMLVLLASSSSSILWGDALSTIEPTFYGFTSSTTTGTTHTAPNACRGWWQPGRPFRDDPGREPITVSAMARTLNGGVRGYNLSPSLGERMVSWHRISEAQIKTQYAAAARPYNSLDWLWGEGGMSGGKPFRLYGDLTDLAEFDEYTSTSAARPWKNEKISDLPRYEVQLSMGET